MSSAALFVDRGEESLPAPIVSESPSLRAARVVRFASTAFLWLFAVATFGAVLAFPLLKNRPIGYVPVLVGLLCGGGLWWARERLTRVWLRVSTRRFLAACVLVGLLLRVAAVATMPLEPVSDHLMFHLSAVSVLAGEGYGGEGYRAFYPPAMSFVLVGSYALFGVSVLVGKGVSVVASLLLIVLLYDVVRRLRDESTARWSAVFATLLPTFVLYSATVGYELVLATLLLGAIDLAVICVTRPRGSQLLAVVAGCLLGMASLVKPICLPLPALFAVWWWTRGLKWKSAELTCYVAVGLSAVILPWSYRNYVVLGSPVLVSTNGGVVLYSANNPETDGLYSVPSPLPGEFDELSRDRVRLHAARQWMLQNPWQTARLALVKTGYVWGTASSIMSFVSCDRLDPQAEQVTMALLNVAWTAVLTCLWLSLLANRRQQSPSHGLELLVGVLALVFAIHLFSEALSRHHIPVAPVVLALAAAGLSGPLRTSARSSQTDLRETQGCSANRFLTQRN